MVNVNDIVNINGVKCKVLEIEPSQMVNKWEGDNLVQVEMHNTLVEFMDDEGESRVRWEMIEA